MAEHTVLAKQSWEEEDEVNTDIGYSNEQNNASIHQNRTVVSIIEDGRNN